ncbi:MAG: hypothetical protein H6633_31320 [Anaerolineales bacterium]|nr:hypothetical protein [Anaerolineales bacterium]
MPITRDLPSGSRAICGPWPPLSPITCCVARPLRLRPIFQQLLRTGRQVILLLDGLDEVPDEAERAEVRQAIEDLLRGRESCGWSSPVARRLQGRTALGGGFQETSCCLR